MVFAVSQRVPISHLRHCHTALSQRSVTANAMSAVEATGFACEIPPSCARPLTLSTLAARLRAPCRRQSSFGRLRSGGAGRENESRDAGGLTVFRHLSKRGQSLEHDCVLAGRRTALCVRIVAGGAFRRWRSSPRVSSIRVWPSKCCFLEALMLNLWFIAAGMVVIIAAGQLGWS